MKHIEFGNGEAFPLCSGTVKGVFIDQKDHSKSYGYIAVEEGRDVRFMVEHIRRVEEGISHPKFGDVIFDTTKVKIFSANVLFLEPETGHYGNPFTRGVVFERFYKKVLEAMSVRPIYRVIHTDSRYKGQFTTKEARTSVYAEGSRQELEAKYPRLAPNDPLSPIYETGPLRVRSEWQVKDQDGIWKECRDPRSFPLSVTKIQARVLENVNGEPVQRHYGHMGNLLELRDEFIGDRFTFEIRTSGVNWTEIGDPRVKRESPVREDKEPVRKAAEKPEIATERPKPVPMQKSGKPRPTVLKDLGELKL